MKNKLLFIIIFFVFTLSYAQYNIDDTQTMSFTDISTTGTEIPLEDDGTANITAPWTLYLGSQASTDLLIGNNGVILFGVTTGSIVAVNDPLTTSTPMIAPFWDDLDTELGGVYYQTITHTFNGISTYNEFIIQWDRVHYNGNTNTDIASFEVVFKQNIITQGIDKTITFIYNDVDLDGTSYDDGVSATIGVATADEVSQYSYNTASLTNVTTIIFSVPTTNVPDDNFESYLETHNANGDTVALGAADSMGNGIMDDNIVPTSRIKNVTSLDVNGYGLAEADKISDLTGIEDFMALTSLSCWDNDLTSLDVSANIALTSLSCSSNSLSTLDVSANTALTYLSCNSNSLSTLDVSGNTALTSLDCSSNSLSTLDVSTNIALTSLHCNYNDLSTLDLNSNTALTSLVCYGNNLTNLDVSTNTALTSLYCSSNDLSTLNLDNNNHLEILHASNNPNLTTLHIQNGANNLLAGYIFSTVSRFDVDDNPNLTCIFVDNATDATNGINDYEDWQIDATATFVETEAACDNVRKTNIPDDNFEAYLETHNANTETVALGAVDSMGDGIANNNKVYTHRIENVMYLFVSGYGLAEANKISDLTGIEDFVSLTELGCRYNNLSSLDVSSNTALTTLSCGYNNLSSLDVSSNTALTTFYCESNNLTTLDVRNIPVNQINIFDATDNPNLTCIFTDDVAAAETNWTDIDATATFVENEAACDAQFTNVPDDNFEAYLETHNSTGDTVALGAADSMGNGVIDDNIVPTSRIENVTSLSISNQNIADLTGVEDFVALTSLSCHTNDLSTLDLSSNTALTYLYCGYNDLSTLDLSSNTALTYLFCSYNDLSTLNLDNNNHLERLNASHNPNLTTLHIQNGANNLLTGSYTSGSNTIARFRANNNPNLTCIFVDDATDAEFGINDYVDWEIDATATFVQDEEACDNIRTTNVPDDNFEAYLETHNANGNTVALGAADSMGNGVMNDNMVPTSRIENVTSLTISNQNIANLTGIEDFIALTSLDCTFNNLSTLDLSSNIALTSLFCYSNDLSTLNLNNNNHLEILWTFNNSNLTTLHIQNGANHLLAGTFTGGINTYARFRADNNSSLTCIFVDDATDANNGVNDYVDWQIDATATFVQDDAACDALVYEDLVSLGFEIYPNPVKDVLYIRATEKINQIHIYNMLGQEVKRILPSASSIEINLSNLPNGAYFIKAQIGMHNGSYKIIKQ